MSTVKSAPITLEPVIPLVLEKNNVSMKAEKEKYVSYELKIKINNNRTSTNSYTKHVKLFDEGTPYEWIQVVKVFEEICKQNQITSATGRIAIAKTLLRGDSLTTFELAIQTATAPLDGEEERQPVSEEILEKALAEVATSVFPYRALYTQTQWMSKLLRKPADLSIRATISALRRLNNKSEGWMQQNAGIKVAHCQFLDLRLGPTTMAKTVARQLRFSSDNNSLMWISCDEAKRIC